MGLDLIYHWFKVQWCFGVFLYRQVQRYMCLFLHIHWFAKKKPAQSHILIVTCWSYWAHQRSISLLFSLQICITAPSSLADWSQIDCSKFIAYPVSCVCPLTHVNKPFISVCFIALFHPAMLPPGSASQKDRADVQVSQCFQWQMGVLNSDRLGVGCKMSKMENLW